MDFNAALDSWRRVLLQPGVPAFQEEKTNPNANLTTAIIWVVIAAIISGILGWLQLRITSTNLAAIEGLPPEMQQQLSGMMGGGLGLWAIIIMPILFLIMVGLMHVAAQALGGQGDMGVMAYLVSTYHVPLTIISAVVALIPFLGGCISFLLSIYGIVLAYFAAQANYGLTSGKAIVVALVPLIIGFCIGGLLATVLAGFLIAAA